MQDISKELDYNTAFTNNLNNCSINYVGVCSALTLLTSKVIIDV